MKKSFIQLAVISAISILTTACYTTDTLKVEKSSALELPSSVTIKGIALNPEGIEYNKNKHTFLLSSLNAAPVVQVNLDGTYKTFTSGEAFPMSTAGLQIDYKRDRLLVAAFNGLELMDNKPQTKGASHLRIYNLTTGVLEQDIDLSSLAPKANAYFANDVAVDNEGNVYISDWYANLIYKVDLSGKKSIFWKNNSGIEGGPNGLDFHANGHLLVSLIKVSNKGLYTDYGLVKIPLNDPKSATNVKIPKSAFSGFDGMVITQNGDVVGVTNSQKSPGGNMLISLYSKDNWNSANVVNTKDITASTTVAITPQNENFVINQDFTDNFKKSWKIEKIKF